MGLFTPLYMKKTLTQQQFTEAVKKLEKKTDQQLLEIAHKAPRHDVIIQALKMISDQKILADTVLNDPYMNLREYALDTIDDPAVLLMIALADTDNVYMASKVVMRIKDRDHLEEIVQNAALDEPRLNALYCLKEQNEKYDLSPYQGLIVNTIQDISDAELVSAVEFCKNLQEYNSCALVSAIRLCQELSSLEILFERIHHLKELDSETRRRTLIIPILNDTASALVRDCILSATDVSFLEHLSTHAIFTDKVHEQAKSRLKRVMLSDNATQQEIFNAARSKPEYIDEALDRLTDNNLLYRLVIEGVTGKKGLTYKAIDKIRDPQLLSNIAYNQKLDFQSRARAAKAGNIRNPFGSRTLVCPRCGKAAIYKSVFESIDSYQTISTVSCAHCGLHAEAGKAADTFKVGEDVEANLRDSLIFICPQCGGGAYCHCNPKPARIPVIFSRDSDFSADVNL